MKRKPISDKQAEELKSIATKLHSYTRYDPAQSRTVSALESQVMAIRCEVDKLVELLEFTPEVIKGPPFH